MTEITDSLYTALVPRKDGNDKALQPGMSLPKIGAGFLSQWLHSHIESRSYNKEQLLENLTYKVQSLRRDKKSKMRRTTNQRSLNSVAKRKQKRIGKVEPQQKSYTMYIPLHGLWKDYIKDLLQLDKLTAQGMEQAKQKLLRADYHGAIVSVRRSKCPSLVGIEGIVVRDTRNTFQIVTTGDELKTVPKQNTVFDLRISAYTVTIYGNNFRYTPSDRATRQFKSRHTIDI